MESGEIQQHILHFIRKRFTLARKRKVDESHELLESGILDSLGILDVVSMLEKDFGIAVRDEDLTPENFQTVVSIAYLVRSRCARRGQTA